MSEWVVPEDLRIKCGPLPAMASFLVPNNNVPNNLVHLLLQIIRLTSQCSHVWMHQVLVNSRGEERRKFGHYILPGSLRLAASTVLIPVAWKKEGAKFWIYLCFDWMVQHLSVSFTDPYSIDLVNWYFFCLNHNALVPQQYIALPSLLDPSNFRYTWNKLQLFCLIWH